MPARSVQRALMPLHKPKCLPAYHQQLSYCVTQVGGLGLTAVCSGWSAYLLCLCGRVLSGPDGSRAQFKPCCTLSFARSSQRFQSVLRCLILPCPAPNAVCGEGPAPVPIHFALQLSRLTTAVHCPAPPAVCGEGTAAVPIHYALPLPHKCRAPPRPARSLWRRTRGWRTAWCARCSSSGPSPTRTRRCCSWGSWRRCWS